MVYIYTLTLYYLWMVNNAGLNVSMVCLILNFFDNSTIRLMLDNRSLQERSNKSILPI